jgi:surfeit locus 1 family protein
MVKRILFIVFVALVGTGILMSLGKWQLDRLAWKQQILRNIETRITDPEIPLPTTFDPAVDKYQSVSMRGTLRGDYIRVLGSLKLVGAVNKIIAPVVIDQRVIMVDLGYLKEEDLERLALSGDVAITGNLHWPDETDSYTPPPDLGRNLWFVRDTAAMAQHFGAENVIVVAKSIDPLPAAITIMPLDTTGIPNDHLNYAITWFSLAVVWIAMSALFIWRTRRKKVT